MTGVQTTDPMVTVRHMRAAGLCARGGRVWALENGFDWGVFVSQGIAASRFEATGDPFALRVAALARNESVTGSEA